MGGLKGKYAIPLLMGVIESPVWELKFLQPSQQTQCRPSDIMQCYDFTQLTSIASNHTIHKESQFLKK